MSTQAQDSEIAERLRDLWAIIRMNAHIVYVFAGVVVMMGLIATLMTAKVYRATALVHLVPKVGQEVKVQRVADFDAQGFQEIERFYRTQLELIKTRSFARQVLQEYRKRGFDDLSPEEDAGRMSNMITASPRERSQIIEISVMHTNPQKAAILANLVAKVYVTQNLQARQDAATEARSWLQQKTSEYETRIQVAHQRLLDFQEEHDLVDADEGATAVSARKSALDQRYGEVSTERVMLATRYLSYEALLGDGEYEALAGVLDTPVIQSLIKSHGEATAELATLAARYGPRHPDMERAQARVERIEGDLELRIREAMATDGARLTLLEAQEAQLLEEIAHTKDQLLKIERVKAEFTSLKLDLERTTDFYKTLSGRSDELDLSSRTQLNNARVVDTAETPVRPVKPRVALNLILALLAGLGGGAMLAVVRSYMDETISKPADVQTFLKAPYLGLIPQVPRQPDKPVDDLYTHQHPESMIAEAIRGLRTMLDLGTQGVKLKRLLITSAVAAEGKTGTCIRIGIAFAQQGKRVCLVDGDHRRARMHKVFPNEHEIGLLDLLQGEGSLEEAIGATTVPQLDLLPLGHRTEEANKLLTSAAMEQLLEELAERYDRVIIDSPPAAALSEAVSLSKMVDGVVIVARAGQVSRSVARHTLDRFAHVDANLVGIVLNDVPTSKLSTGAYYYYDYYGSKYYQSIEEDQDPDRDDRDAAAK
ncbi:MAG: polysaccharide biosynthesis tyrosine autokinase [Deltaproteobacteria bacterium]|nr:polysaccharide biosynthesis tyrosine autokinase [Deltaproteobacteria bacterium]